MKVEKGKQVEISYILTSEDGNVVAKSESESFIQGEGSVFKSIEREIGGMLYNQSKKITIPAKDAFGEYHDDLLISMERGRFEDNMLDDLNQKLYSINEETGEKVRLYIKEIKEDVVIADANHPLSGKDLYCDLTITSIREGRQ